MKKDGFWRGVVTLVCITALAGALLSFVYGITKDPIAQAKAEATRQAYRNVYRTAASFSEIEGISDKLAPAQQAFSEEGYSRVTVDEVLAALDADGQGIGFVLSVTSKNGYGGDVRVAIGVSQTGEIQGFQPLVHSESPGYGAKCDEEAYQASFVGKTEASTIDAISGATYTTNAIREAVGAALMTVRQYLQ